MEVLIFNVFNAVYQENLSLLKDLIRPLTKIQIQTITSSKFEGTTLLLIAARHGHYHIIKYLIEHCDVDIEQVGKVEFDGETVHDTPPLWCAAAAGNIDCVKLLIEHGANVNCTTYTNSTPLRAACFDGHFEIVKYLVENGADIEIANKLGHTCLMISCFKRHYNIASYLIEQGCQINRQSMKGNTALHDCAESNSMDIMKLLVKNGAIPKRDCFGLTPLMTACINGNIEIFNYLKSVFNCTIEEETDAYRLLGATFVDKLYNMREALKYWKQAASLTTKCNKKYLDSLINNSESYKKAYNNSTEFRTQEELENLLYDPELMKYQAMMIRERVLSIHHPDTYYFIRIHGESLAESGKYSRCLSMWMYNLEQQQNYSKPLNDITQNSFLSLIELFTLICNNKESDLNACDILKVLEMAISQVLISCNITPNNVAGGRNSRIQCIFDNKALVKDERFMFNGFLNPLDRQFLIVIHLIDFMCQFKTKMSPDIWIEFQKLMRRFLSCDPRSANSQSLLHIICILSSENETLSTNEISFFNVFQFIVDLCTNLNIVDIRGNTALHFLMDSDQVNPEMVEYLVDAGAHIDLRNDKGLTPLDLLDDKPQKLKNRCQIQYVSLQCLCAQTIIKHGIPISETIPKDLQNFINDHHRKDFFNTIFTSTTPSRND
ncbi:protein fem-1 homolog C [Dermatophagoides pteronyssinus]|uniref:Protein fem-1 C n=1 Tax=Dermatophagoides pteronyssinus TaxID=6956 RepID=A0ABQ8IUK3_DERPT|nr:Protein fem-1 C [Dermatophagoides pteronyssinus]